jgi:hypothetical protein
VPPPEANDFDPNELVKEHGRDIGELRASVEKLVNRFGDDDCFGKTFEHMASKDKRIDKIIKGSLQDLIKSDPDTQLVLKEHVKAIDRNWLGAFGKRLGFALWSIALVVAGAAADHFIK